MATGVLAITNTSFPDNSTADGSQVITNFNDILDYVNNRDDGTAEWQVCNVTATTTAAMTVSGNQGTTLLQINNTATDGDPTLTIALGGTVQFSLGVDDGDSDVLKIGTTAIGTGTMFEATSAGEITKALQPAFLVTVDTSNTANVTGDGTAHTMEYNTEIFDQGSDFNTGTFTYTNPITGRVILTASARVSGLTDHLVGIIRLTTSNRNYDFRLDFTGDIAGTQSLNGAVVADMDASDTVTGTLFVDGGAGGKIVEVNDTVTDSFISGPAHSRITVLHNYGFSLSLLFESNHPHPANRSPKSSARHLSH